MSSIDIKMGELRGGLRTWGKEAGRQPSGHVSSVEKERAKLAYVTASDSLAELEVRSYNISPYAQLPLTNASAKLFLGRGNLLVPSCEQHGKPSLAFGTMQLLQCKKKA